MAKRTNKTPTVADLCEAMDRIAPTWAAAEWDNVGLLVGANDWPAARVMLTIDLTAAVLDEALRQKIDALICYHPVIFKPVKRLIATSNSQDGLAATLLANRIAVYSPHTAMDAAPGGTNETLATLAGATNLRPFTTAARPTTEYKVVAFVPDSPLEKVSNAMFAAGAGRIGNYEKCSYRLDGRGTFFGTDSTNPTVGASGRLETVDETRVETVVSKRALHSVIAALIDAHPYEEPAYDIYPLTAPPQAGIGQGRIGDLPKNTTLRDVADNLKAVTKATAMSVVGNPKQKVKRALVCVGAAGTLPFATDEGSCETGDVVITGEVRHHDALSYQRSGAAAIALGHWTSERPALKPLEKKLKKELPGIETRVSSKDCEPFRVLGS